MSGSLLHPPEQIVHQLLTDLGVESATWPLYRGFLPDEETKPDEAVAVFGADGRTQGRGHPDGEMAEKYGIQVRTRSGDDTGFVKCHQIALILDTQVYRNTVLLNTTYYIVQSITRTTQVIPLGIERGSRRRNWTVNAVASIKMVS